ncbi:MAG: 1,4-dihydroxy-6-naphthoate synthase [Chitinophagaceae bacterium]|nr:1,4-dihydroxy-6-naphthoate synthase [Chitinophagaceae bacterium]
MHFTIGFSPCPNDTFIFDALVNQKIDTEGFSFEVQLEDVQTLNLWAKENKLNISKISYGVLPLVQNQYDLLNSGGALGKGVGPLLISRKPFSDLSLINEASIAIPGINTTAHLLFSLAFPNAKNKKFLVFNEIESAVLKGDVDAGVIIHENRFTYHDKGLIKLMDLGAYWEEKLECPIPLGGIIMQNKFDKATQLKVESLIRRSVEFAFRNYPLITDYTRLHAQEMSESVMRQHIDLYVNDYSIDLGVEGRKAVEKLLEVYQSIN